MKLLKLTIVNMASLEGEHVIDFEDEPLKSTGLFSIVGDTGSGKSTILDAICLALYGLAPRFFDSKKIDYYNSEQKNNNRELQPDDPRNILRRGTKECSSEVVFLARDNHKYRARWSCSFARTNYTDPMRSLHKLVTGADGKVTEVKVEISNARGYGRKNVPNENLNRIIGLDYSQFTRTALLAQNSFANFIKADAKDKAVLLEMLTGTELYTKVAKKIYEKFKEAEQRFYELENVVKGIQANLLSDEHLEQLSAELDALDKAVTGLLERQESLKKRLQLAGEASRLLTKIEALQKESTDKEAALLKSKSTLEDEQKRLSLLREKQEQLAPEITKARETKVEVKAKKAMADKLRSDIATLKANIATLKKDIEDNHASQAVERKRLSDSDSCLLLLSPHKTMLDNAELVTDRLTGLHTLMGKLESDKKAMEESQRRLDKRQAKLDSDNETLKKSQEALAAEKLRIDEEDKQLRLVNVAKLQERTTELKDLLEGLKEWSGLLTKGTALAEELHNAEEKHASLSKQLSALEDEQTRLLEERKAISQTLPGMEDAYRLMTGKSVTQLRASLSDGQPCPVCGATVHPYNQGVEHVLSPLKEEIDAKRKRGDEINSLLDAPKTGVTSRLSDVKAGLERERVRMEETRKRQQEASDRMTELQTAYPDVSAESISEEMKSVGAQLSDVKKAYDEWIKRDRKLSADRTEYERKLKALDKSGKKIALMERELEGEKGQLKSRLSQMNLDVKVMGEKRLQLMETVSIEDWQTAFDRDFEGFMDQLSEMLKTYRDALTTQQSASSRINELRVADEGLHRQSDEKRESLEKLLPESKKADEEYSAKRGQLEKLLDGRDPDVLERELKSAVTEQGKKVDAALNNCHNIEVECAELKTKGQEARKRHEECLAGMKELKDKEGEDVIEDDALETALKSLADELKAADDRRNDVRALLKAHRTCEEKMKGYKSDLDSRRARYADWRDLNSILGNANGDKLRETAQCFTLGLLVRQANAQLQTLGRRYGLEQVKDTLGIRIIDHDRADEQRNISSLSGGETFVISLALALGLSAISSRNTPMANLFVDEGFGSLDSASLNMVIDALSTLESAQGKKVGVISHTPEMRERIHTQIRVVKTGSGGKSYIEIV